MPAVLSAPAWRRIYHRLAEKYLPYVKVGNGNPVFDILDFIPI
jgi:hypothetical protein